MREIKFRAWDGQKMWDDPVQETDGPEFTTLNDNIQTGFRLGSYTHLMQYTGLKDKNGVEIYDGDIVDTFHRTLNADGVGWSEWERFTDGRGRVYFSDYDFRWRVDAVGGFSPTFHTSGDRAFEVIGNVWENPELLS